MGQTLSKTWYQKKDYDKAMAVISDAIKLDPSSPWTYNTRGVYWDNKGDKRNAITDYSEAIRLNPKVPNFYANRGRERFAVSEYQNAIADFDEAVKLEPKDPSYYEERGRLRRITGDYDKAITDLDMAIKLGLKNNNVLANRGAAFYVKGEYDKAITDLNLAIRLQPKDVFSYEFRARSKIGRKDYEQADGDFVKEIRINPKNSAPHFFRAALCLLRGMDDTAADEAEEYLGGAGWKGTDPIHASLIGYVASRRAGKNDRAQKFLADVEAKGDKATWPFPLVRLVRGEINEGDVLDLIPTFDGAEAVAHCFLGLNASLNGKSDAALVHHRWVKEHDNPQWYYVWISIREIDRLEKKESVGEKK